MILESPSAGSTGDTVDTGDIVDTQVVVIGAGQAGLASAHFLTRAGLRPGGGFVVLDANAGPGGAWQHRWPSLRLDVTNGVHDLPGLAFAPGSRLLPAAEAVPAYFAAYEQRQHLDVQRPVHVRAVSGLDDGRLDVRTDRGTWRARALVSATGTWTRPFWPTYPGQETFTGRQLHTVDYVRPQEFAGQHVVVVGGGISAVQLLGEISRVTTTSWVTRRPPQWNDSAFTPERGRAAVAEVEQRVAAGLLPGSVVGVTGLPSPRSSGGWVRDADERGVLERLPMFDAMTPDGVRWDDGRTLRADVVLWATGFRHELAHLAPLHLREPGGGITMVGTRTARDPRVHLVGFGPSASTLGAGRAARAAVREIRGLLAPRTAAQAVG